MKAAMEYGVAAYEVISNPKKTNKLYDVERRLFVEPKSQPDGLGKLY